MGLHVAIAGASGVVGREFLRVLEERRFPVSRLDLLASARSAGGTLPFRGEAHPIRNLGDASFEGVDVALFSAGADVSRAMAPRAAAAGALVVDNSSAFRLDPDVPLVVPQVNGDAAADHRGIIANPNCSTILLVMVLAPLEREVPIRRVVCATYQAVSGSGAGGLTELDAQAKAEAAGRELATGVYPKPIHGNVLPFVQAFGEDDLTLEEWKMVRETQRIFDRPDLGVTATCVRVPVRRAHSEAVNVEFEREVAPDQIRGWLTSAPGVRVVDDPATITFPTPRDAEGKDDVLVGRIRRDPSHPRAVDLWLTGDQLRKGAALNAVEIAEAVLGVGGGAPR
ncbi:MAG: aspartate-semialdehyde dehydrogenase [Planctomycetota bacterium]|jgi:aspartate-semialdehyde dehydrogenase